MVHTQPRHIGRFFCTLIMLAGMAFGAFAQSSTWKKAQRAYTEYGDYEEALSLFKKDLEKKPNVESTMGVAGCYRMLGNRTQATEWYNKALGFKNVDPTVHLYLAEILLHDSRYEEAKNHLTEYKKSPYASPIAVQRLIATCDSGIYWMEEAQPGVLKNEDELNTANNDWGTSRYANGIAFCSDRQISINTPYESDPYHLQRVLMADADGDGWKNVKAFERPINGANYNSGPIVFAKNGTSFIEARSNGNPDIPHLKVKTINNTGLYYTVTLNDGTTSVMPFDYNNVVQYCVDGPCLSLDEQTLYFSSNKPGGYGGFDIYYSIRNADGTWSEPQNCGSTINTSGDEMYPTIGDDGTMYFASNGHIGIGGLDIFSTKGRQSSFSNPINLGCPINSGADDFSLLPLSKDKVLFSSNRTGGKGGSDIYSFAHDFSKPRPVRKSRAIAPPVTMVAEAEQPKPAPVEEKKVEAPKTEEKPVVAPKKEEPVKPAAEEVKRPQPVAVAEPKAEPKVAPKEEPKKVEPVKPVQQPAPVAEAAPADEFAIRIETVDKNKEPLGNTIIRLVDNVTGRATRLRADANGVVTVNIVLGASYSLMASRDGYASASIKFTIPNANKKVVARLTLESLILNRDIRIAGLYYEPKRWNLKEGGEKELDKLVKLLNDNPRLQVEIKSYTNEGGNSEANKNLSQRRAHNVLNYLAFKGIEEDRIYAVGYGSFRSESGEGGHRTMYRLFKEGERNLNAADTKRKAAEAQRAKAAAVRLEQQKTAAEVRKKQQAAAAKKRADAAAARQQQPAAKPKPAPVKPQPQQKKEIPPQPFESFEIKPVN